MISEISPREYLAAAGLPIGAQAIPLAPPDRQSAQVKLPQPVNRKIGYAIVGLGKLAVEEILPAFQQSHCCKPVALVSGHRDKAEQVAAVYSIDPEQIYDYDNFERIAENEAIEAVYIVLPNNMHAEFTIRAFQAGKHVLCEKPMAVTAQECEQMIAASEQAQRKLMIAYRLHYEPYNQKVMDLCKQGALGRLKIFTSSNSQTVEAPNIRLSNQLGGGPVGDVGIYSINAARYVIGEEPAEVSAFSFHPPSDPRFREVPESVVYTLRYPSGVLAHCECGFGHAHSSRYRAIGDKGWVEMDPAFSYSGLRLYQLTEKEGQKSELRLESINQFAAEMDHFAQCIIEDKMPKTPGELGLADVRIIQAIYESAHLKQPVKVANGTAY
ncbi:MAG: Gfo/Idh/MocA family oxidoreductase [Caldilineaceae bacterium]